MASFKHAYFLSYPHEPASESAQPATSRPSSAIIADALYAGLRGFGRRWNAWADLSIFSDKRSLPAGSPLWDRIEGSVRESSVFLLLAVGRTASSPGVAREIGFWKKHGGDPERFLILWVEGEIHWVDSDFDWSSTTVLPNCLQGYFPHEPTIVDMRWMRKPADLDVNSKPFRDALATILSPVRGVPPGELLDEANAATRKALVLAKSAVAVFAMLSLFLGGAAWYATRQRSEAQRQTVLATDNLKEANRQRAEAERQTRMAKTNLAEANRQRAETERQKNIAQVNLAEANQQRAEAARQTGIAEANLAEIIRTVSAGLLAKAIEYIGNGRVQEGTVLAAEAVQKDPQNWPAYATVFEGLARLRYRPMYTREWCDDRDFLAISSDGAYVATVARQGDDGFKVTIEHTTNGQIAQFELPEHPDGAVFSADMKYLFLVGTEIVVVDVVRERFISRIVAKTSEYLREKLLLDPDPSYFWTVDFGAMHRFDMRAQAYDNTVVAFQKLKAPGFNGTAPTNVASVAQSGYWALGISGQSEGYTGEADDTGRIFVLDRSDAHVVAFINSGLVSDMAFIGGDDRSDALYVAKPGGTIEIWPIPRLIRGSAGGDEPLQLEQKEIVVDRPAIDFYVRDPDPKRSSKTQIVQVSNYLAAFTSGRLSLIDLQSRKSVDSGVFDSRDIRYFSDAFRVVKLSSALATVSQNAIIETKKQCGRLQLWNMSAGGFEIVDLREAFRRAFEERQQRAFIFKDLGFTGEWKLKKLESAHTRVAYLSKEADTRYSTRFVLNIVDVYRGGSALIASYPIIAGTACSGTPALSATGAEVCAACRGRSIGGCVEWSGASRIRPVSATEFDGMSKSAELHSSTSEVLSRIVRSVGGDRVESVPDGSVALFRKSHTPLLWRGTDVLRRPADEIRSKAMALTGLRVRDGFAVEVNATRYATR